MFHIFKYFVFNCDSRLNVVSFKIHLMLYLCLNIIHILMLFRIFKLIMLIVCHFFYFVSCLIVFRIF